MIVLGWIKAAQRQNLGDDLAPQVLTSHAHSLLSSRPLICTVVKQRCLIGWPAITKLPAIIRRINRAHELVQNLVTADLSCIKSDLHNLIMPRVILVSRVFQCPASKA